MENWNELAPSILERARREAVGGVMDVTTAELVHQLRTGADAEVFAAAPRSIAPSIPVVDVHFTYGDNSLRWFSIISTFGTPIDVTAQELRLEAFFPSDDETAARWDRLTLSPDATATSRDSPRVEPVARDRATGIDDDDRGARTTVLSHAAAAAPLDPDGSWFGPESASDAQDALDRPSDNWCR